MNLRKLGLILACLMLLMATAAHAENDQGAQPMGKMQTFFKSNHFGKDWGFALGVKTWANEWSLPIERSMWDGSYIYQCESDMEIAFIPTGLVRYRNFFIGGSYMPNTDYDFTRQTTFDVIMDHINGEREEWDLNIGYFLTPNLAVTFGYKKMERELTFNLTNFFNPLLVNGIDFPLSVDAPIIGLAASLPINENFSFYGNLAYGWLSGDAQYHQQVGETIKMDLDGNYYFGELGFNYVIPIKKFVSGIAINLGYRFQRLEMEADDNSGTFGSAGDQSDTTSGFTFGVSVAF